jgi:hypothetical protein
MRVDFSDWNTDQAGLIARKYTYSQMEGMRNFDIEVHVNVQAGAFSIHSFINFVVSLLDFPNEAHVRGLLRLMDGSGSPVSMRMLGTPRGVGAVITPLGREDAGRCIGLFLEGKALLLDVDSSSGEKLLNMPLPNDPGFETAYRSTFNKVKAEPQRTTDPPLSHPSKIIGWVIMLAVMVGIAAVAWIGIRS